MFRVIQDPSSVCVWNRVMCQHSFDSFVDKMKTEVCILKSTHRRTHKHECKHEHTLKNTTPTHTSALQCVKRGSNPLAWATNCEAAYVCRVYVMFVCMMVCSHLCRLVCQRENRLMNYLRAMDPNVFHILHNLNLLTHRLHLPNRESGHCDEYG